MKTIATHLNRSTSPTPNRRSLELPLSNLNSLAANSSSLLAKPLGHFDSGGDAYSLPRYLFIGPRGGSEPIRIGIFAGIHGDQPETTHALAGFLTILEINPDLAKDFFLFAYPICNPTGFEDNTRASRRGRDLNREFWNNSIEPEVTLLQSEICCHAFDGIITLHADETSEGVYGLSRSTTFARHLLDPALTAAEGILPRAEDTTIDGFPAHNGVIRGGYSGSISGPPKITPRPFEIALCAPKLAPQYAQERAMVAALQAILASYREFIAYAPNL